MTPDVSDFIINHLQSIEQLEVLLLLRENKDRFWSAAEVNEVIRSSESSIEHHLKKWLSVGVLRTEESARDTYSYSPTSPELEALVDNLAYYYRDRRTMVIEQIYSKSLRELRTFSDAFIFKKEEK